MGSDEHVEFTDEERQELVSNAYNYEYSNGRKYNLQPDEDEPEYLDVDMGQHVFGLIFDGELTSVPMEEVNNILDYGCGTGKWALDMAMMYGNANVKGVDLETPQLDWTPDNVNFEVGDINEASWNFKESFDLVHIQRMFGTVTDWSTLCKLAYKNLSSGGYIEIVDVNPEAKWQKSSSQRPHDLCKLEKLHFECYERMIKTAFPADLESYMKDAGFTNVKTEKFKRPTNTWPNNSSQKEIGKYQALQVEELEGLYLQFLCRVAGMTEDDARDLIENAQNDLTNTGIHAYHEVLVYTGRKE